MKKWECLFAFNGSKRTQPLRELFDKIYLSSKGVTWEALPPWWVGITIVGPGGCCPRAGTSALSTAGLVLPQAAAARRTHPSQLSPTWAPQLLSVLLPGSFSGWKPGPEASEPFQSCSEHKPGRQDGGGRNADLKELFWVTGNKS